MFFVIFLIFRHSFFLSSWTADFAKKAKRVSFNLYFKDARRLFLKLDKNFLTCEHIHPIPAEKENNVVSLIVM